MERLKNYSEHVSLNQVDITKDGRDLYKATSQGVKAKREGLKALHAQEKQELMQHHGQDLRSIFVKGESEPPALTDWRVQRCRKVYERKVEEINTIHERIEMYQEVGLKREWDMRLPNDAYPSHQFDKMVQRRHDRYVSQAKDPRSDKAHIHRELEHDQTVKSYMDGRQSFDDFRREFTKMNNRHMAESIPVHEKQFEAQKIIQNRFIMDKD